MVKELYCLKRNGDEISTKYFDFFINSEHWDEFFGVFDNYLREYYPNMDGVFRDDVISVAQAPFKYSERLSEKSNETADKVKKMEKDDLIHDYTLDACNNYLKLMYKFNGLDVEMMICFSEAIFGINIAVDKNKNDLFEHVSCVLREANKKYIWNEDYWAFKSSN